MSPTPELHELLARTAPEVRLEDADRRLAALWEATKAADTPARSTRWQRRSLAVAAATAAACLGLAGVAAANGGLELLSGFFDRHGTESVGQEEFLNVGSAEFKTVFAAEAARVRLPAEASYAPLLANLTANGGVMQRTGLRGQLVLYAACEWDQEWLQSDAAGRSRASIVLTEIAADPALKAIDGGGVVDQVRAAAEAAAAGNADVVAELSGACR